MALFENLLAMERLFSHRVSRSFWCSILACWVVASGHGWAQDKKYRIATGSKSGFYTKIGNAISEAMPEGSDSIEVVETNGSIDNLKRILKPYDETDDKRVNFAIVQGDLLMQLQEDGELEGIDEELVANFPGLRSIAAVMPEYVHAVVRKGEFTSSAELINAKVFLGKETSGSRRNASDIINFIGMKEAYVEVPELDPESAGKKGMERFKDPLAAEQIFDNPIDALRCNSPEVDVVFLTSNQFAHLRKHADPAPSEETAKGDTETEQEKGAEEKNEKGDAAAAKDGKEAAELTILPIEGIDQFLEGNPWFGRKQIFVDGRSVEVPFTRAVLIVRERHAEEEIVKTIAKLLRNDLQKGLADANTPNPPSVFINSSLSRGTVVPLAKPAKEFYDKEFHLTRPQTLCIYFIVLFIASLVSWILYLRIGPYAVLGMFLSKLYSLLHLSKLTRWIGRYFGWVPSLAYRLRWLLSFLIPFLIALKIYNTPQHPLGNNFWFGFAIFLFIFALLLLCYFTAKNLNSTLTPVTVVLTIATMAVLFGWIVVHTEELYSTRHGTPNGFATMSTGEFAQWLFTFGLTGFNGEFFPSHSWGKVAAGSLPLGGILLLIYTFYKAAIDRSRRHESYARGLSAPNLSDHVVICGWNYRVPILIRQISEPQVDSRFSNTKVIVIASFGDEEKPLVQHDFRPGYVYALKGYSSDTSTLAKASVHAAKAVLIVADLEKVARRNERGVLTASALKRHLDNPPEKAVRGEASL